MARRPAMAGESARPVELPPHPLVAVARAYQRRRSGDLSADVSLFALLLREVGIPVPVAGVLLSTRALAQVDISRQHDFRTALRCCMTAGEEEGVLFDVVFPSFWAAEVPDTLELAGDSGDGDGNDQRTPEEGDSGRMGDELTGGPANKAEGTVWRATYSRSGRGEGQVPVLQAHGRELEELSRRLAHAVGESPSRRRRGGSKGDLIDLRDSLRYNLRFGEEMVQLRHSYRVREWARLVVLCDVSSSMQMYTPLFLAFVHSLTKVTSSVESAIFNVDTSFVTDVFKRRLLGQSLTWLRRHSVSLAGGTRIGHSMYTFNSRLEQRGSLRPRTTALILSDGWDVGDSDLLEREMRRLREQVGRLIWLDPHAAATGYRPAVHGLRIALPFIDDYLDFSDLPSLRALVSRIEASAAQSAGPPPRAPGVNFVGRR
jgi:uncharacterized protein with von Willebrand factor type A (vWA) domain